MWAATITTALALSAYLGYYVYPLIERPWAFYVASAVLVLWLAYRLRLAEKTAMGVFAYTWIMIEAGQQAACGAFAWGAKTGGKDVCKMLDIGDTYLALGALSIAAAWAWRAELWPSRSQ